MHGGLFWPLVYIHCCRRQTDNSLLLLPCTRYARSAAAARVGGTTSREICLRLGVSWVPALATEGRLVLLPCPSMYDIVVSQQSHVIAAPTVPAHATHARADDARLLRSCQLPHGLAAVSMMPHALCRRPDALRGRPRLEMNEETRKILKTFVRHFINKSQKKKYFCLLKAHTRHILNMVGGGILRSR